MTPRGRKHLLKPLVLILAALALEGCISPSADSIGRYTAPIGGSPVISNETPYSTALRCMSGIVSQHPVRIAVGQIADYTGKIEADGSGRKVTAGAALMAMTALSKAGVHMVERFDTSVAELELKYANNKLIGDDKNLNDGDFRKIMAESIPGSDYYIVADLAAGHRSGHAARGEAAFLTGGTVRRTASTSPFYAEWVEKSQALVADALAALEKRDLEKIGELVRARSSMMHAKNLRRSAAHPVLAPRDACGHACMQ